MACSLDLIGDRWVLLIVRDLLLGKERFEEFLASREGIATNILSDRLKRMMEAGLVERRASADHGGRATYALTKRGLGLKPVMGAVARWGLQNFPGTRLPDGARRRRTRTSTSGKGPRRRTQ